MSEVDRRRGLGRGLGALIPSSPQMAAGGPLDAYFTPANGGSSGAAGMRTVHGLQLVEIEVTDVRPNPRQPRQVFDPDELAELATSLREVGMLQPVVVRALPPQADERYELVVGERRWRAAREAGLERIPALVRQTSDEQMLRDALLENLHRAQLNVLEEAAAYAQLLEEFGCTQEELAARIGRSRPQIANTIRLLRLPALVQRRVAAGVLSAGHARALLALEDPLAQETLAQRIVAEGLSVRSVEEIVAGSGPVSRRRASAEPVPVPEQVSGRAAELADRLDTRVRVDLGRTKGRLTIEFASVEDFERIVAALLPTG